MITYAKEEDREALIALWMEVFGDGREYPEAFYESCLGSMPILVERREGVVAAVLHMVMDVKKQWAYFYALATRKDQRGQGIMSKLMEQGIADARLAGCQQVFLIPAEESLFQYYKMRGFTQDVLITRRRLESEGMFSFEKISTERVVLLLEQTWELTDETIVYESNVKRYALFEEEIEKNVDFYELFLADKSYGYAIIKYDGHNQIVLHYGMNSHHGTMPVFAEAEGVRGLMYPLNGECMVQTANGFIPF